MAGEYRCLSADDLAHAIAEDRAHLQSEAPLSDQTSPRRRARPCGLLSDAAAAAPQQLRYHGPLLAVDKD